METRKNLLKNIDIFGEWTVYLFLFSMFVDSKLTLKMGYVLQFFSVLKLILDRKNITVKYRKGREIYITFFVILILGIFFNLFSSFYYGAYEFVDRNIKFMIGMMILFFIDNQKKLQRITYFIFFASLCLALGIIYNWKWIHLDIIRQRGIITVAGAFVLGYLCELFREFFSKKEWRKGLEAMVYSLLMLIILKGVEVSDSRMAFFSIVGVLACYFIYIFLKIKNLKKVIYILCIMGISMVSLNMVMDRAYKKEVLTSFDTQTNLSNVYRIIMWKGSLQAFLDSPITGVGSTLEDTGPYIRKVAEQYSENPKIKHDFLEVQGYSEAHSIYFNFLAQTGLLILAYLYLFFYQIPKRFLLHGKSKIAFASLFGIVAFYIYGITWSIWGFYGVVQKLFQVLLAILIVAGEQELEGEKSEKRIVFYMRNLNLGGITNALVNLLNFLTLESSYKYDISILVAEHQYDDIILKGIPNNISINFILSPTLTEIRQKLLKRKIQKKSILFRGVINISLEGIKLYMNFLTVWNVWKYKFDTIVDFQGLYLSNYLIFLKRVKKISVIHENKYDSLTSIKKINKLKEKFQKYHNIVILTKAQCSDLKNCFPDLKEKFVHIYTVFDIEKTKKMSEEPFLVEEKKRLERNYGVMLARLSPDKDFETVLKALYELKKKNKLNFSFYFLGEGTLRNALQEEIINLHLENNVFLLGQKENPYKWIAKADFMIMSSYSEGLNNAIVEGLVLQKIVISSKFRYGAEEILGKDYGFLFEAGNFLELFSILEKITTEKKKSTEYFPNIRFSYHKFLGEKIVRKYEEIL